MAATETPTFDVTFDAKSATVALSGALTIHQLAQARDRIRALAQEKVRAIDLTKLEALDTAGALYLREWAQDIPIHYHDDRQKQLVALMNGLSMSPVPPPRDVPGWVLMVEEAGQFGVAVKQEAVRVITFGGKAAVMLACALSHPKHLRLGAVAQHIHAIGFQALPIIGLMAFLISVVLAYQGVAQLRPYGGEQFTVNLVALSILREMGVLLTAIMVAGRSGSAFTAEIGVMKAREEVDALQVMGFPPFDMLVTPRLIAIVIALPLLTFYADIMGLVGGYVICHSLIDISLSQYIERIHQAVAVKHVFVGLMKAPVFAFVIGIVGCMHGLRVQGSAESIGQETTRAVVKSIFLVLVLDAFFSILFEKLGL